MHALSTVAASKVKAIVALVMAFVAGMVDIIGYISFGHMFTAHLTGDTVHLGQHFVQQEWTGVASAGTIILAFLIGSIAGRTVIEAGSRLKIRSIATAGLLLEACLLLTVMFFWSGSQLLLLALLAAAMGMQTATLTRVGPLTVHTTFVTGMLNKLAQLLSHTAFLTYDVLQGSHAAIAPRLKVMLQARFIFGVWFCYLLGAVAGTWARSLWQTRALLLPIGLILLLVIVDGISPLSIEEEREASER